MGFQRATTSIRQKMTVVSKIRGSSTSERLMHEPRNLKHDSLTNWQPVQLPQHWCDVVTTTGACDQRRVQPNLRAIGFQQKDTVQSSISTTPPCLLDHPRVNFDLHHFRKQDTPPEIYRSRFHELCSYYDDFYRLYTDCSKIVIR